MLKVCRVGGRGGGETNAAREDVVGDCVQAVGEEGETAGVSGDGEVG